MTREDIIRMALEAGFGCDTDGHLFTYNRDGICDEYLERFANLVVEAEREACAKVCDNIEDHDETIGDVEYSDHYSNAIRARSNP